MAYRFELHHSQGYLRLVYDGTIHARERSQARDEAFELCRQNGLRRSLVDMRGCDFRLTPSDAVRFASEFETAKLPPNYRLACIIPPGPADDSMVGSLISLNGVNIKYFHSEQEAISWLTAL
jgi:hypothetical protein